MADAPEPELSEAPQAVVPAENAEDLYEHAPCGYLSCLPDGTIIKVNETLLGWLGFTRAQVVGRRFAELLTAGGRIYHETHYAPLLSMQGAVREIAVDFVKADGARLPALINSVLVRAPDGRPHVIRTSVFDATDRREYEQELVRARVRAEESETRARVLAETLQRSLIPPSPPEIPGLVLAAAYRPAGAGDEVGGDFYDVFETGEGDWGIVVGDVCGKGAAAATVTALARHTVRAAAIRDPRPSEVLGTLNTALLKQADRFVTAVYLRVCPTDDGTARVTIASAGHALPILLGRAGVAPVGRAGSLLGVLEGIDVHDTQLDLTAGEALFTYTDGLTEGRSAEEFFGETRLLAALEELHGQAEAGIPHVVVERIVEFQGGRPRDDMAAVLVGVPAIST